MSAKNGKSISVCVYCLGALLYFVAPFAGLAQAPTPPTAATPRQPAAETDPPSITLSPAVVMARMTPGQTLTQRFSLLNSTAGELTFELVAQDVIVRDGLRVYVPAGELPNSVAARAVFSVPRITIPSRKSGAVELTLTLPLNTEIRAIVAIFRGVSQIQNGGVGMTGSLGALVTINVTEDANLQLQDTDVKLPTATSNLAFSQWAKNIGKEPILPKGVVAVLNESGKLVAKAQFQVRRLLPGERASMDAEVPLEVQPGKYNFVSTLEFEGKTTTKSGEFVVR